ncbi:hypothetical protein [Mycobacteroides abscessus]|uniref:hypothetical protein n=1 Tax=Mycobacteroides abscessus TaxID=36809 RepID=UPI0012FFD360|nr:hypothetical protein [Mycobacteroides abscessus]
MTGKCPQCGRQLVVRSTRGSRIADHQCPDCHVPLQGITAGQARGRYMCPISGDVVTLGLRSAVALDGPYRLMFVAGQWNGQHRDQPNEREREKLERVAGRVLGRGCVINSFYDPAHTDNERAGLRLVPADPAGIDPARVFLNTELAFRKCMGCGATVPDIGEYRHPRQWTPRQKVTYKGRGRARRSEATNPGPHAPGSPVCDECRPE